MAKKKKIRKNVVKGIAYVKASFNNTIITITDVNGETLAWDPVIAEGHVIAGRVTYSDGAPMPDHEIPANFFTAWRGLKGALPV